MNILTKDVMTNAVIYNKNSFYVYPGHSVDFIIDTRAAKQGWFSTSSSISGNMYNTAMYGEQMYGNILVNASAIRIEIDLQEAKDFDVIGITNTNVIGGEVTISWGTTAQTLDGSKTFPTLESMQTYYLKLSETMLTYQYVAIEFTNTVSEGILKIGNVGIGQEYELPAIAPTYDTGITSSARRAFTTTRQLYGGPNVMWRTLSFTTAPQATKEPLFDMIKQIDVYHPIYWEFSEVCLNEAPLYGVLTKYTIDLYNDQARLYSGRISLEEVY